MRIDVHLRDEAKREMTDRLDAYLNAVVSILREVPEVRGDVVRDLGR